MRKFKVFYLYITIALIFSCNGNSNDNNHQTQPNTLFTPLSADKTQIKFKNTIDETVDFNVLNYYYAYNGGGVSVGDVNNDGLNDIYFTSNQKSNKLYLNLGNFKFKDITLNAGVQDDDGWTTGTTMIDVNNDGWLDLYVCKSASLNNNELRKNKLFVNQKNGTFKEEAKSYGLDDDGFSIQSYFFDYDLDGDLDMFLINHRVDFLNSVNLKTIVKDKNFYSQTSDHLYRNDGDKFVDITSNSGLINKEFSLSASIGDFNNDGWPDIYVANDFITPDKLYINNQNGKFQNQINKRFKHTSYSSMGSDFADINNDLFPDLLVLDMSAEDHIRGKQNMPSMNVSGFWSIVKSGYHYQYMSNILNLNNANGYFTDIAQHSGISKTDWSWAPLIADFDGNGFKDIFITNGIKREIANQDFGYFLDQKEDSLRTMTFSQVLEKMPSEKLQNYMYQNDGDLTFSKTTDKWGLKEKLNSNGAAYADLDNDGDLDLIVNNLDDIASIYVNNSTNNYITLKLVGSKLNLNAIGSKVRIYTRNNIQQQEVYLSRGYQSSIAPNLSFGLGNETSIEKIEIIWNDETSTIIENAKANQTLTLYQRDANQKNSETNYGFSNNFQPIQPQQLGINYRHTENQFNDFESQVLLPQKQSEKGPPLEIADINNDGLDDLFLGGAVNHTSEIYLQKSNGKFEKINQSDFDKDKKFEDLGAKFFDCDNDGDLDLYVSSGSYEFYNNPSLLQDRLYLNDGKGNFTRSYRLPKLLSNTKAIQVLDYDNDGDLDLFVGGHVYPGKYPLPSNSFILENRQSKFVEVTKEVSPDFTQVGIVNDFIFSDFNNDGQKDLVIVGEWMPITFLKNNNGQFIKTELNSFKHTSGWWNTISQIDYDNDGDLDFFIGNLGNNNKFHPSVEKPLFIYGTNLGDDENYDMFLSKTYKGNMVPVRGKECSTQQNPFVSDKITSYKDFANSTLSDIYGEEILEESYQKQVVNFKSLYAENLGDGNFNIVPLPSIAQLGPTTSFVFYDINGDAHKDVIGSGAIHESEVETVRYDSNIGYVLLHNTDYKFSTYKDPNFYNDLNAKHMRLVFINDQPYIFIANNNRPIKIFKIN